MKRYGKFKDKLSFIAEEESIYRARTEGDLLEDGKVRPKLIDLFAGAGGMTLGFTKLTGHIFQTVWANDFNDYADRTYNANFNDRCIGGDIVGILDDPHTRIPKADVVIGGPPCQGFSLLNKNRNGDQRKELWRPYMEVVERSGASIFVMENVPELLNSFEHGEIIGIAEAMLGGQQGQVFDLDVSRLKSLKIP
ncbi:MAG: DNA cytosine methyltransferase [Thermodesulfovibrionales bacterium]